MSPSDASLREEALRLACHEARRAAVEALRLFHAQSANELAQLPRLAGPRCVGDWRRALAYVERACEDIAELYRPASGLEAARLVRAVGLALDELCGALVAERWPS